MFAFCRRSILQKRLTKFHHANYFWKICGSEPHEIFFGGVSMLNFNGVSLEVFPIQWWLEGILAPYSRGMCIWNYMGRIPTKHEKNMKERSAKFRIVHFFGFFCMTSPLFTTTRKPQTRTFWSSGWLPQHRCFAKNEETTKTHHKQNNVVTLESAETKT